jgi:TPR repeat protein
MKTMFMFLLIAQCSGCVMASQSQEFLGSESHRLADSELRRMAESAMAGDPDAALRISDHYYFDHEPGDVDFKQERAKHWAIIAAENGDRTAQFRMYQLLRYEADPLYQTRAIYWLKSAANGGNEYAKASLITCPTLESVRSSGQKCYGPRQ